MQCVQRDVNQMKNNTISAKRAHHLAIINKIVSPLINKQ